MHRQIFRSIREGNTEAARNAMRDHLLLAQKAQAEELAETFGAPLSNGNFVKDDTETIQPKNKKLKNH